MTLPSRIRSASPRAKWAILAAWLAWEIAGAIRGWIILGPVLVAQWHELLSVIGRR